MHKSKLTGFIIDCQTDDIFRDPNVASLSQISDIFDIVQQ